MTYFISGHRDLTPGEFDMYYRPKIDNVLGNDSGAKFVVGDYPGADILAQEYLAKIGKADLVTVYHMFNAPNCIAPEISNTVGGFKDDISRDSTMTNISDFDIAFIFKPGNTGTMQNIMRRIKKIRQD